MKAPSAADQHYFAWTRRLWIIIVLVKYFNSPNLLYYPPAKYLGTSFSPKKRWKGAEGLRRMPNLCTYQSNHNV